MQQTGKFFYCKLCLFYCMPPWWVQRKKTSKIEKLKSQKMENKNYSKSKKRKNALTLQTKARS